MRAKLFLLFIVLPVSLGLGIFVYNTFYLQNTPESLLKEYYSYISKKDYERMYDLLCRQSREDNPREDFIQRNAAIYEGIEIKKIRIRFDDKKKLKKDSVNYHLTFDTVAGKVSAAYSARIVREKRTYRLIWDDSLIFPELSKTDKVRVLTKEANRGTIYDRRGKTLAGEGTAVSVNIVPGKCSEDSTERLAELTGLTADTIEKKLGASWVKEDSLVPIQTRKKITELVRLSPVPNKEDLHEYELQEKISAVDGVELRDIVVREYPLSKAGAHLAGYVQEVTASIILDDLTKVIEDPHGTGHGAYMKNISLAGKTGTAELKASKDDSSGTEIGWFAVMTTDPAVDHPILVISMVEDVKNLGGSGYVVEKTRHVLEQYIKMDQND